MIQAPRTRETPCRGLGRGRRGARASGGGAAASGGGAATSRARQARERRARRERARSRGSPPAGPATSCQDALATPVRCRLRHRGGHPGPGVPPSHVPPTPGCGAADTHSSSGSERRRPRAPRWRERAGSQPPAAAPAGLGARRPPWRRGRRAGGTRRDRARAGGSEAATAQARPSCPAPQGKPETRAPAQSGPVKYARHPPQKQKK